jgi:hypothetical protein
MTASLLSPPARTLTPAALVTVAWFGAAMAAGAAGVFHTQAGVPPVAVGVAAAVPPLLVVGLLVVSARFRAWARALDLRLLTMLQTWRVAGLAFVALSAQGTLPTGFALPAGFGDIIVGLTAPFVAVFVIGGGRWAKRAYYGWTFFGIADLITAVTLGVLHSNSPIGLLTGTEANTEAMAVLPMSLIPTFGVPLTLALHAISLVNVARSGLFESLRQ